MDPNKIKDSIQAVVDGLTPLAQKLQVPISNLWLWSIKHNYALATTELLLGLISVIFVFLGIAKGKWTKDSSYDVIGNPNKWAVVGIFGAVIFAFGGGWCLWDGIMRVISPEWMTALDLRNLLK